MYIQYYLLPFFDLVFKLRKVVMTTRVENTVPTQLNELDIKEFGLDSNW